MRWSALFADLESQLAAAGQVGLEAEASERARTEYADLTLAQRLAGQLGRVLEVHAGAGTFTGTLRHVGRGWVLLEEPAAQVLVSLGAVRSIGGMDRYALTAPGRARLGLASALRGLSRNRSEVAVFLAAHGAAVLRGRMERVGADFFELSAGQGAARVGTVVALDAVAAVRAA